MHAPIVPTIAAVMVTRSPDLHAPLPEAKLLGGQVDVVD